MKPCALFRSLVLRGSNYDVGMDVDVRDQLGRVWRLELSAVVFLRSRRMVEAKTMLQERMKGAKMRQQPKRRRRTFLRRIRDIDNMINWIGARS